MPELGELAHGQAASLLGAARSTSTPAFKGQRHIWGGRAESRRMPPPPPLAKRHDPAMKAFAERLTAKGKKPKVVVVAVMRKLIEAANLVLARQDPKRPHEQVPADAKPVDPVSGKSTQPQPTQRSSPPSSTGRLPRCGQSNPVDSVSLAQRPISAW